MTCKDCFHFRICYRRLVLFIGTDELSGKYIEDIENLCDEFASISSSLEKKEEQE